MSAWKVSRKSSVARAVAAIVAVVAISCAAKDRGDLQPASASAQRDGGVGQACLGRAPTQVLSLTNTKNARVDLGYFHGCGWRYLPARQSMDQAGSDPAVIRVADAAPLGAALPPAEPLTIFVDGPTGYTFVWSRDGGWKFAGEMTGKAP